MDDLKWSWWVGSDEESYHTECATRDEAVQIARDDYDGAWITEAAKPANIALSQYFISERFLDDADEQAYDYHGNYDSGEPVFDLTAEQCADLEAAVKAALDAFQAAHGLVFTGYRFMAQRHTEFIPAEGDDNGE